MSDGATASWVINQYFQGVKCLAQGHNTAAVGIEPRTSRSGVRHSTTERPRSPNFEMEKKAQTLENKVFLLILPFQNWKGLHIYCGSMLLTFLGILIYLLDDKIGLSVPTTPGAAFLSVLMTSCSLAPSFDSPSMMFFTLAKSFSIFILVLNDSLDFKKKKVPLKS